MTAAPSASLPDPARDLAAPLDPASPAPAPPSPAPAAPDAAPGPGSADPRAAAYERFLGFVRTLTNYEEKRTGAAPPRFDLERMRALARALGHPERAAPAVHLAGSKGKGTTAALVAALLAEAGLRVGLYTSPHLIDLGERIAIDGAPATPQDLGEVFAAVEPTLAGGDFAGLTFFELVTALAFVRFARAGVGAQVIETGLGGRLDSTNVIEPAACVITSIGLEHTALLGSTLGAIAAEKAGILKPGVPAVLGPLPAEALAAVDERAARVGAPLLRFGEALGARALAVGRWGTRARLRVPGRALEVDLALVGARMAENAALAVAAADLVLERTGAAARLTDAQVAAALARARVPGRFEVVPGQRPALILDVAHTRESVEALAAAYAEAFPEGRATVVLGVLEDKDLDGILRALAPIAARVIAAPCASPRQREPGEIAARARALGLEASAASGVEGALEAARAAAGRSGRVIVTGSFYLVGEVARILRAATL